MDTELKVYIANMAGHDFTEAERYGKLKYITVGNVSLASLDRLKFSVTESLKESSENDWLLLSGKAIVCVMAALIWYRMHKKIKLLVHDHRYTQQYRELIITETNLDGLVAALSNGA